MLHIIKQIKRSFIGFLVNTLNHGEGLKSFDTDNNDVINKREINIIIKKIGRKNPRVVKKFIKLRNKLTNETLGYKLSDIRSHIKGIDKILEKYGDENRSVINEHKENRNDAMEALGFRKSKKISKRATTISRKTKDNSEFKVERRKSVASSSERIDISKVSGKTAKQFANQIAHIDNFLDKFNDEVLGRDDIIGKKGLAGLLMPKEGEALLKYIDRESGGNKQKFNKLQAFALKVILSIVLSGGSSVSIPLFGIKIGEKAIRLGNAKTIARKLGFKNPVTIRDVLIAKDTTNNDKEIISDLLAREGFNGGANSASIDKAYFGDTPALIKVIFKFLGVGSEAFELRNKLMDSNVNIRERKKLTILLQDKLDNYEKEFIDKKVRLFTATHPGYKEAKLDKIKIKAKNDYSEIKDYFAQYGIYKSNNQTKDFYNSVVGKKEISKNVATFAKNFDKANRLRPSKGILKGVGKGRFGKSIPANGITESWIKEMKTHSVAKNPSVTAYANLVGTFVEHEALNHTSVSQFDKGLKTGRFLTSQEVKKFKTILKGNLSTSMSSNFTTDAKIYVFVVDHKVLMMKQNCSNPQDITDLVSVFGYKPEYFTVSMSFKIDKKTYTKEQKSEDTNPSSDTGGDGQGGDATGGEAEIVNPGDTPTTGTGDIGGGPTGGPNIPGGPSTTPVGGGTTTVNGGGAEVVGDGIDITGGNIGDPVISEIITTTSRHLTVDLKNSIYASILAGTLDFKSEEYSQIPQEIKEEITRKIPEIKAKGKDIKQELSRVVRPTDNIPKPTTRRQAAEKVSIKTYTVKRGDTLSKIAKRYGTTYRKLAQINGIKKPYILKIGQKIEIFTNKVTNTTTRRQAVEKVSVKIYTVKKGDNLSKIAKEYGTTYRKLAQINGIKKPYILKIGQKIEVK